MRRSDTPQHRPRRKLLGKMLSPLGRSGKRWAANRNQTNWFAAIAVAMTWLRVSSSGAIADAASVSANATDQRHRRGRRRSRSSLATRWEEGPGPERARPLLSGLHLGTMLTDKFSSFPTADNRQAAHGRQKWLPPPTRPWSGATLGSVRFREIQKKVEPAEPTGASEFVDGLLDRQIY